MFRSRGSVALQEQAAVALCGFFSVPLTYKDTGTSDMWGKVKKMTLEPGQIQRPTLVKVKEKQAQVITVQMNLTLALKKFF